MEKKYPQCILLDYIYIPTHPDHTSNNNMFTSKFYMYIGVSYNLYMNDTKDRYKKEKLDN